MGVAAEIAKRNDFSRFFGCFEIVRERMEVGTHRGQGGAFNKDEFERLVRGLASDRRRLPKEGIIGRGCQKAGEELAKGVVGPPTIDDFHV